MELAYINITLWYCVKMKMNFVQKNEGRANCTQPHGHGHMGKKGKQHESIMCALIKSFRDSFAGDIHYRSAIVLVFRYRIGTQYIFASRIVRDIVRKQKGIPSIEGMPFVLRT